VGACAPSTTWKFVPPKPNALTPASRSSAGAAHGRASVWNANGLVAGSQAGLGRDRCSVGGRTPVCRASAALITPAIPAAHLVCPICDFTEPSTALPGRAPDSVNSLVSVSSSVRSPTTVPVPCASIMPTSRGDTPAPAYARSSARRWPSARGAVRPSARPSLAPPRPLITE
jgi:hypothetical protein